MSLFRAVQYGSRKELLCIFPRVAGSPGWIHPAVCVFYVQRCP